MEKYKKYPVFRRFGHIAFLLGFLLFACDNSVAPTPATPVASDYTACAPTVANTTFDILTWNIENFPLRSETTAEVAKIITTANIDLIAFQEVSSATAVDNLLAELPGWAGKIEISGNINLGYLYKTSEVTITDLGTLYDSLSSPFPRPPVVTRATHTSGLSITFINIHLKCCGGADNVSRRTEASELLQQYIDQQLANDPVILLGDFNDEITTTAGPTPFQNFIDASNDYLFVDMAIALDQSLGWSYPSWPSHIDHILVTNELFANVLETATLKPEACYSPYTTLVSDHRPVMLRLQ